LDKYGAVQLFVARIQDVKPDFALDGDNAAAIVEICRRLDGLPLALELAAVRIKLLTPQALLQRLERRLPLLMGGARDMPERQQTMRATIAWSYDLLSPDQQTLFRRLGVFPGGWTLESAEAVAATGITFDFVEALAALVDASLAHVDDTHGSEHRYRMLETVREFAVEQLEASSEALAVRSKLVDYFLRLAETDMADPSDAAQRRWEVRVTAEHGNIRAALAWLRDHGGNRKGVRLVSTLSGLWSAHNGKAEGRSWMATFLDPNTGPELPPRDRIAALRILGSFAGLEDDRDLVEGTLRESLDLARREGDAYGVYTALNAIGQTRLYGGDVKGSTPLLEEAIKLARAAGDWRETASTLAILAYAVGIQDELERAEGLAAEALALTESYGAPRGFEATVTILAQGWFALIDDACDRAEQRFQAALDMSHDLDVRAFESSALAGLGNVALSRGSQEKASSYFREGVVAGWDGDFPLVLVKNLMGVVDLVVSHGEFNRAAHLIGAVDSFGNVLHATPMVIRRRYESDIEETRRMLGEDRFKDECLRGKALRPADIVAEALAQDEELPASPDGQSEA
jgi:tetratricopeptide (TPR) repeat protein